MPNYKTKTNIYANEIPILGMIISKDQIFEFDPNFLHEENLEKIIMENFSDDFFDFIDYQSQIKLNITNEFVDNNEMILSCFLASNNNIVFINSSSAYQTAALNRRMEDIMLDNLDLALKYSLFVPENLEELSDYQKEALNYYKRYFDIMERFCASEIAFVPKPEDIPNNEVIISNSTNLFEQLENNHKKM